MMLANSAKPGPRRDAGRHGVGVDRADIDTDPGMR